MKTDAEVQSNEPIITHSSHKPVLRPNWVPKGRKKFFYAPPPLSPGLDVRPPLIWRSGYATDLVHFWSVKGAREFFSQWRGVQVKKTRISWMKFLPTLKRKDSYYKSWKQLPKTRNGRRQAQKKRVGHSSTENNWSKNRVIFKDISR